MNEDKDVLRRQAQGAKLLLDSPLVGEIFIAQEKAYHNVFLASTNDAERVNAWALSHALNDFQVGLRALVEAGDRLDIEAKLAETKRP